MQLFDHNNGRQHFPQGPSTLLGRPTSSTAQTTVPLLHGYRLGEPKPSFTNEQVLAPKNQTETNKHETGVDSVDTHRPLGQHAISLQNNPSDQQIAACNSSSENTMICHNTLAPDNPCHSIVDVSSTKDCSKDNLQHDRSPSKNVNDSDLIAYHSDTQPQQYVTTQPSHDSSPAFNNASSPNKHIFPDIINNPNITSRRKRDKKDTDKD